MVSLDSKACGIHKVVNCARCYYGEPVRVTGMVRPEQDNLAKARKLVDEQAHDEALWADAETVVEAYLQQHLRRLHAVIEGDR